MMSRSWRAIALVCVTVGAVGCRGGEPDPLASMAIPVSASERMFVVSLPLVPEGDLSIVGVEPVAGPAVDVEYLGFVTRCDGLCGLNAVDPADLPRIRASTEGTVPIEVGAGAGPHLLLAVRVTDPGMDVIRRDECLVVRDVRLELASGEILSVRRADVQFLWVLAADTEPACLGVPNIRQP